MEVDRVDDTRYDASVLARQPHNAPEQISFIDAIGEQTTALNVEGSHPVKDHEQLRAVLVV
jgi:hypothetical protein